METEELLLTWACYLSFKQPIRQLFADVVLSLISSKEVSDIFFEKEKMKDDVSTKHSTLSSVKTAI